MSGKRELPDDKDGEVEACRAHREDLLDEALEESFPASDPPSIATSTPGEC